MDLETRKITFVQEFLKIQSEEVVIRLEKLLKKEREKIIENDLVPLTLDEFNQQIDQSEKDIENGRIIEVRELVNLVEK